MKKYLILFIFVFFSVGIVGISGMVLAETTYTATTDTTCNGNVCTKTLYSGIRNVYEDNQWKRVEEARSLKDKGFKIKYLENDKDYPIEVLDFNYTSIKVKLNPKGIKIFNENVPLRVWNNNDTKARDFEQDVRDGKKQSKGIKDYKEKMDKTFEEEVNFNLLNQEEEMILDFGMGEILEFGFNSTTLSINSPGDDTFLAEGDDSANGDSNLLRVDDSPIYEVLIGFDISSLPEYSSIDLISANITVRTYSSGSGDYNISLFVFENQTWTEDNVFNETHRDSLQVNHSLISTNKVSRVQDTNNLLIALSGLDWIHSKDLDKFSVLLNSSDGSVGLIDFDSKEVAGGADASLTIIYSFLIPPNVTINSPLNQTYNTNSILFNVTALGYETVDKCEYSLTNGVTNYSMTNISSVWNATNSTMSEGNHTVSFYCNDTSGNLNNSESVTFSISLTISGTFNLIYWETTSSNVIKSNGTDYLFFNNTDTNTQNVSLYNLTNSLIFNTNGSIYGNKDISSNDGNINITLPPNNASYVLDRYENLTEGATLRQNDPLAFKYSILRRNDKFKKITNSLQDTITVPIIANIGERKYSTINKITYTTNSGVETVWVSDQARALCDNSILTFPALNIESSTSSNEIEIDFGTTTLQTVILKLVIGFIALLILMIAVVGVYAYFKDGELRESIDVKHIVLFFVILIVAVILGRVLIEIIYEAT